MPSCAVVGCPNSSSKKSRGKKKSCTDGEQQMEKILMATEISERNRTLFENVENDIPLKGEDTKYFPFPKDAKTKKKWQVAGGQDLSEYGEYSTFCSCHFDREQYNWVHLKKYNYFLPRGVRWLLESALPTRNMPKLKNPSPTQIERKKRLEKRKASFEQRLEQAPKQAKVDDRGDQVSELITCTDGTDFQTNQPFETESPSTLDVGVQTVIPGTHKIVKQLQDFVRTSKSTTHEAVPMDTNVEVVLDLAFLEHLNGKCLNLLENNTKLKEENKKALTENKLLKKLLGAKDLSIKHLEEEKSALKEQIELAGGALNLKVRDNIIRDALKDFFSKPQLDRLLVGKETFWTEADYLGAVVLACMSSRSYEYIRNQLKYPLPALSCVKRFASRLHCVPGVMLNVLKIMQMQASLYKPMEKLVVLTFDEVKISGDVCYYSKQDRILGSHRNAQVLYVRALFSDWGTEIYYGFDEPMTPELLCTLDEALTDFGFTLVAVDSDLGGSNRGFYAKMGITEENQEYVNPKTGHKFFFFSDSPHDLKNGRNHLMDEGVVLNPEAPVDQQEVANKTPLVELLGLAPSAEFSQHNLTWKHIQCRDQDRQKVDLAAQTLSERVSKALQLAWDAKKITSPNCLPTMKYCRNFNTFLDIFNVKEDLRGLVPPEKLPVSKMPFGAKFEEQKKLLDEIYVFVSKMRLKTKTKRSAPIFFQQGVMWNCRALPKLYLYIKALFPEEEVLIFTYRLNQDCLEILFSILRAVGGSNTCPSPVEFAYRITNHVLMKNPQSMLRSKKLNVLMDKDTRTPAGMVSELLKGSSVETEKDKGQDNEFDFTDPLSDDDNLDGYKCSTNKEDGCEAEVLEETLNIATIMPIDVPASNTDADYNNGVIGLAGVVACRLMPTCPELSSPGPFVQQLPVWVEKYAKGGLACPSEDFMAAALKLDAVFLDIHKQGYNKMWNVMEEFEKRAQAAKISVDNRAIKLFGWLRLCVRLRAINNLQNKKKDTVLEVNKNAKKDKNCRQAKKMRQYRK